MSNVNKTGYEKVKDGGTFYAVLEDDYVAGMCDHWNDSSVKDQFDGANYYSSKEIAENNMRADKLMRNLRRLAAIENHKNGGVRPKDENFYEIFYDYDLNLLKYEHCKCSGKFFGQIRFNIEASCIKAIKEFENELFWYFTEYKSVLDTPNIDTLKVDTPVYVSHDNEEFFKRYYKSYDKKNDVIITFPEGKTSWSYGNSDTVEVWDYYSETDVGIYIVGEDSYE